MSLTGTGTVLGERAGGQGGLDKQEILSAYELYGFYDELTN